MRAAICTGGLRCAGSAASCADCAAARRPSGTAAGHRAWRRRCAHRCVAACRVGLKLYRPRRDRPEGGRRYPWVGQCRARSDFVARLVDAPGGMKCGHLLFVVIPHWPAVGTPSLRMCDGRARPCDAAAPPAQLVGALRRALRTACRDTTRRSSAAGGCARLSLLPCCSRTCGRSRATCGSHSCRRLSRLCCTSATRWGYPRPHGRGYR